MVQDAELAPRPFNFVSDRHAGEESAGSIEIISIKLLGLGRPSDPRN